MEDPIIKMDTEKIILYNFIGLFLMLLWYPFKRAEIILHTQREYYFVQKSYYTEYKFMNGEKFYDTVIECLNDIFKKQGIIGLYYGFIGYFIQISFSKILIIILSYDEITNEYANELSKIISLIFYYLFFDIIKVYWFEIVTGVPIFNYYYASTEGNFLRNYRENYFEFSKKSIKKRRRMELVSYSLFYLIFEIILEYIFKNMRHVFILENENIDFLLLSLLNIIYAWFEFFLRYPVKIVLMAWELKLSILSLGKIDDETISIKEDFFLLKKTSNIGFISIVEFTKDFIYIILTVYIWNYYF
jgi:hypothetical protein